MYRMDSISSLAIDFPEHNIESTWRDNKKISYETENTFNPSSYRRKSWSLREREV